MTSREFEIHFRKLYLPLGIYALRIVDDADVAEVESQLECGVNLYLATVSQSCYYRAVYKWNADEGILGDLSDIGLAESKLGYSNVSTGAGVVAARSIAGYTISLKEFLATAISGK